MEKRYQINLRLINSGVDYTLAKPLDPREIVTVQKLAVSNLLEIEALRQLLFEKGLITEEEFIDRYKKLDREMKERGGK